ncbi:cytochrome P450 [Hyalangium versicolor]|uniref:cytochrome P450 n=1 Tax=Hyalangium versicolor TaxID=2861190 RepID=UPI001CCC3184|nr:cytochrome P450 [Hyalangium versicolor]
MSNRINLMAPEVRADPYTLYAELRKREPVCQVDPGNRWIVTRHEDVMKVLKNPQLFSATAIGKSVQPPWLGRNNPFADSMFVMDPPNHGRLRTLVSKAFGPGSIAKLEPRIRAHAQRLAAELPLGQPVDFVESFALQLPAVVLAELMGLDVSLHSHFKRWSDHIVSMGAVAPDDVALQSEMRNTVNEMERYLKEVLEDRRREPREDLVSDLLRARVDDEALTERELLGFLYLLLVAGLETTVYLLGHSVRLLMERPDVLERVRADFSLLPRFVDEVLRYEPPVHGALRVTMAEVELGGVHLPPGQLVLALVGSACRDESIFPDAGTFVLDRPGPQNLPFGHGAHFCLGPHLAKLEGRLGLEALLSRCSRLSPGEAPIEWNASLIVRGPTVLPVVLHPAG